MLNQIVAFSSRNKLTVTLGVVVLALAKSIQEASNQDMHGDGYIYWAVGRKFIADQALYEPIAGAQEYIYPPVAALLFQLLALLPFPVAMGVFTFFNFLAWVAMLWLTFRILRVYFPQASLQMALFIGFVATIRYFWHTIVWVNANALVGLLSLAGLYAYVKSRQVVGLGLLSLAMWIKVMPLLLVGMLIIRRPWQTIPYVLGFSALFALFMIGFRGLDQGIQDYFDYWYVTFKPFLLEGRVYTDWIAFGLSATLSKLLLAHPDVQGIQYNVASWSPEVVGKLSLVIRLLLLTTTYVYVWKTRRSHPVPLLGILLTFLTMLLISGVAWEGHHLTLLLVIAGLYQLTTDMGLLRLRRWLTIASLGVGLLTPDTIGGYLALYIQAFSLITYLVLFLYGSALLIWIRQSKVSPQSVPPPAIPVQ